MENDFQLDLNFWSLDERHILEQLQERLEEMKSSKEYTLYKYTWDGKKPYSPNETSQVNLIQETRDELAKITWTIRKIEQRLAKCKI